MARRVAIAARWAPFAVSVGLALALVSCAGSDAEVGDWPGISVTAGFAVPAGSFLLVYLAIAASAVAALVTLPVGLSVRKATQIVFVIGVIARLLMLPHPASDDVNRYLWEGRLLAAGLSPYAHAPTDPDDPAADAFRDPADRHWRGINHPGMTAIYPPLALIGFAGLASIHYDPLTIKVAMAVADSAALGILLALLSRRRTDPRWAFLYALHPLPLIAFAGQGHLDALQVLAVLGALLLGERRRWVWMFLALGLAVQVKYVAAVLLPFFVRRSTVRHLWAFALTAMLPLAPFVATDGMAVFATLSRFGNDMAFNGFVHGWLRMLTGDIGTATGFAQLGFVAALGFGLVQWRRAIRFGAPPTLAAGALFATGTYLVFAPTIHVWYLAPALALAVIERAPLWIVASTTIVFGFVADGMAATTGTYALPIWAQVCAWILPTLLLGAHFLRPIAPHFAAARAVSVIIPARDEADWIAASVRAAAADACVAEVIVVDGGSRDATGAVASEAGATVLVHDLPIDRGGGRGGQIDRGLRVARGDVVAIVHADTTLQRGSLEQAVAHLVANPACVGGALGSAFAGSGAHLRALECANRGRAALTGVSFGDQVQFFRRQPVVDAVLYPAFPLMEDVELSLRLRRLGRLTFLWQDNEVSARRWREGSSARARLVLRLLARFLFARCIGEVDTQTLYRRYYAAGAESRGSSRSACGAASNMQARSTQRQPAIEGSSCSNVSTDPTRIDATSLTSRK